MVELNRLTANGNELQLKDSILADALSMGETHNLPITPETIVGRKRQSQVVLSSGIVSLEFVTYNEVAGMTEPDNAWRNDNNGVLIGEFRQGVALLMTRLGMRIPKDSLQLTLRYFRTAMKE